MARSEELEYIATHPNPETIDDTVEDTVPVPLDKAKEVKTCKRCEGSGLIYSRAESCSKCKGHGCGVCNETGFGTLPFQKCTECRGTGNEGAKVLVIPRVIATRAVED